MSSKNTNMHKIDALLLTTKQAAQILAISRREFYYALPKLIANHGLQPISIGKRGVRYSYEQLRAIVQHCVKTGKPLYTKENTRRRAKN